MAHQLYATPLLKPDSLLSHSAKQLISRLAQQEIEKSRTLPTDDPLDPKRKKRVLLTHDELFSQPEVICKNLNLGNEQIPDLSQYLATKQIDHVYMTGCGDSMASLIAVRFLWETLLGIPCETVQALDFAYFYSKPVNQNSLVIALSSSGSTTRTVEAILVAKAKGATTLSLSNSPGSALMTESDEGILIHAERKGWPTQSSTAAMALLYLLGINYAKRKQRNEDLASKFEAELFLTPERIKCALQDLNEPLLKVAKAEIQKPIHLFTGGGPAFASAMIGAAKVKECTPNHAIAIPLEEYHHYNSQKIGDPLLMLVPTGKTIARAIETAREGRRWGGNVYTVASEQITELIKESNETYYLPAISEPLSPLLFSIPAQLYAYHLAMEQFLTEERLQNSYNQPLVNTKSGE